MECGADLENIADENSVEDAKKGCDGIKRKFETTTETANDSTKKIKCSDSSGHGKDDESKSENESHLIEVSNDSLERKSSSNSVISIISHNDDSHKAETVEGSILKSSETAKNISEHRSSEDVVDLSNKNLLCKDGNKSRLLAEAVTEDDIIVIKDDEMSMDPKSASNKDLLQKLYDMHRNQASRILQLQDSVRREEAKLVLLKKLRQSQLSKHHPAANGFSEQGNTQSTAVSTTSNQRSSSLHTNSNYSKQSTQSTHHSRSAQNVRISNQASSVSSNASNSAQLQANRNALAAMMQMPQLMQAGNLLRGTNPLLLGQNDLASNMQQFLLQQQKSLQQQQQKSRNVAPAVSFKQQQAAAKLSLRKQLEKTLLEIPPPKPPPPEITFLPSAASNEFICLVGLEQVVGKIQHYQTKSTHRSEKKELTAIPSVCMQCKKDFSPLWKSVKAVTDKVICLQCVTTNQKKALKAEHTNRLKTAFVKALQQEQEIEQKMQEQQAQLQSQASQTVVQNQVNNQTLTAAVVAAATQLQQQQAQLKKLQEEQLRRHQKMLQRAQQQYQQQRSSSTSSTGGFRPQSQARSSSSSLPFPFNTSSLKPEERQLLLDMMPQRSRPGNSSVGQSDKWKQGWNWK